MIEDIEVAYLGIRVKVSHSLYKPDPLTPGQIRFIFHLPTREVILSIEENENEEFWVEIPDKKTSLAAELGKSYERYFGD